MNMRAAITILATMAALAPQITVADLSFTIGGTWDSDSRRTAASGALQAAVNRYNAYGDFGNANIWVYYNSGIPTAQASYGGSIGFGGTWPNERVTMHEMAHYLGLPSGNWSSLFSSGTWSGSLAGRIVRQFDGEQAAIRGDSIHFWPYGLNFDSEGSEINRQRHVAVVYGMRSDLGIGSRAEPSAATVVTLTASDPVGESGFNHQSRWTDTHFAHPGADYSTGDFGIRTPASGNSFRFYGDSLTIDNRTDPNGGLLFKGTGTTAVTTIPRLVLDGGWIHHYSTTGDVFRLSGRMEVASGSTIRAKQGTIDVQSQVVGSGNLSIPATDAPAEDARYVRFLSADNAYTGSITVGGRFELGPGANQRFVLGPSGTTNSINGPTAGRVRLNGTLQLVAAAASGTSWSLVTAANTVYGDTFAVEGFSADAGRWLDGRGRAFVESTGRLTAVADPVLATWSGTSPSWNAAANWGGTLPTGARRLVFGAAGPAGTNLVDDLMRPATSAIAGIEFAPDAPGYTISPAVPGTNGFTLTAGISNRSPNLQTIHDSIALISQRTAFTTTASGGDLLVTGRVSGGGGIAKAGAGLLTLSGTSTYSGATRIDGGGVRVTGAIGSTGSLVIAGGTFTLARQASGVQAVAGLKLAAGEAVVGNAVSTGTLSVGAIERLASATVRFDDLRGAITTTTTTANGLVGTWAFTGSGAATRYATVAGGTVAAYEGGTVMSATGAFGGIPSGNNATVNYVLNPGAVFTAMGIPRSIHTLMSTGTGGTQASNNNGATLTVNGILNVGSGRLTIGGSPRLDVIAGEDLDLVVATMTADVTLANGVLDNAAGPSSLTKTGPGLLQIGSGSYTGLTTIAGGTLQVGLGGAGVGFASSQLINDGTVIFNHAGVTDVAGRLSGNGGLRKAGSGGLVITGGGPMDGLITVSSGSFVLAGQATIGPIADHRGGLAVASGAEWVYRSTSPQTIGGSVTGSGRIVSDGSRLVLTAASTFTGTATVASGELVLAHEQALADAGVSVAAGATLTLATAGRATVNRLGLASGGLVDVAAGGLTVEAGLTPAAVVAAVVTGRGDGSWTGTGFTSSAVAAAVAAGTSRTLGWLDNGGGSITVAYAAPGDTNIDGTIDILDAANFFAGQAFDTGGPASWFEGDFTYDGIVDILDAAEFFTGGLYNAGNYRTASGMGAGIAAVPEPAGLSPIGLMVAGIAAARLAGRRGG